MFSQDITPVILVGLFEQICSHPDASPKLNAYLWGAQADIEVATDLIL